LVKLLMQQTEICFDTETTSGDSNDNELVGISFCYKPGEAYFITCTSNYNETCHLLEALEPVFANPAITWVGHNIKYDLLVLKWYGREIQGPVYDIMLAHFVMEPEGRRPLDQLSAQYLGYEPIAPEELVGKGRTQISMRAVEIEKIKDFCAE